MSDLRFKACSTGVDLGFLKRGFKCTRRGFVCIILDKIICIILDKIIEILHENEILGGGGSKESLEHPLYPPLHYSTERRMVSNFDIHSHGAITTHICNTLADSSAHTYTHMHTRMHIQTHTHFAHRISSDKGLYSI